MTPTTYGRDFAYCLKSHGGVRAFNASLWRFLLRCTLFCHSVATFLTSVSSYEGGCGFEVYLTLEERDKVYYTDLTKHPGLSLYRDMFMFQCLVGCRVSDLYAFTTRNITEDGFIEYLPQKTRENAVEGAPSSFCRVPLNDKAKEIIERNMDKRSGRLFPYRNKNMYAYGIKMLLLLCEIDRMVTARDPDTKEFTRYPLYMVATSHTARKTFIANIYKKVKDPELICSMTGHMPGSKSFRRYRHIDDDCKWDALEGIE